MMDRAMDRAIGRRGLLVGGTLLAASAALPARAQAPAKLTLLAHRVHLSVANAPQAGDITEAWRKRTGIGIDWVTLDTGALNERLFREVSLQRTGIDAAFMVNTVAVPKVAGLFEPLDDLMKAQPIEDFGDVFPNLVKAMTFGGKVYGIPFRHATTGLHYNAALFAERGVAGPPKTIEELAEIARKMTYTRADGTKVYGFVIPGDTYTNVVDIARAWDGDFISADFKCVADQPPMLKAMTLLHDFYKEGVLPRTFASIKDEDVNEWMQSGRAAMTLNSLGRNRFYNDPQKSKFPGQFKATMAPVTAELSGKFQAAPVKTEFWSLVIPKNSTHKAEAWSLIVDFLSKENTLKAALNGNGPVRASTYQDPTFRKELPYADVEATVLKYARVPLPAFDNSARAADAFVEEMQAAVLGMKTPETAMADLVRRVQPLLPT